MAHSKRLGRDLAVLASAMMLTALGQPAPAATVEEIVAQAPGNRLYGDPSAPDISGLYLGSLAMGGTTTPQIEVEERVLTQWTPWPPPLTEEYQKEADRRIAAQNEGRQLGDIGARCLPWGMPSGLTQRAYPDEIIQTPGQVGIFLFATFPIIIWTDGRSHPKDLKPSYTGHSIGKWVGDTLYVDTVGIIDATSIELGAMTPHSSKLRMESTIRKVNADTLHINVTLFDEEALTEPMAMTNIWRRKQGPIWQVLDDGSCFENNRNLPDDDEATGFQHF